MHNKQSLRCKRTNYFTFRKLPHSCCFLKSILTASALEASGFHVLPVNAEYWLPLCVCDVVNLTGRLQALKIRFKRRNKFTPSPLQVTVLQRETQSVCHSTLEPQEQFERMGRRSDDYQSLTQTVPLNSSLSGHLRTS